MNLKENFSYYTKKKAYMIFVMGIWVTDVRPIQVAEGSETAKTDLVVFCSLWKELIAICTCEMFSVFVAFEHIISRLFAINTLLLLLCLHPFPWLRCNSLNWHFCNRFFWIFGLWGGTWRFTTFTDFREVWIFSFPHLLSIEQKPIYKQA